ncbi:hypothetical protein E3N88_06918 [Mikania micrantha]|uniref:SWIM-type domain-containing protein n=1 Tax=Mikania micrantha TaxID=192012 RepID=A0A5N6PR39_9ASTR|nr:hypothetical protein E3N88_06918 [Mikania micrantha]
MNPIRNMNHKRKRLLNRSQEYQLQYLLSIHPFQVKLVLAVAPGAVAPDFPKLGGGDHNMSDVLEDHGSVQVDDVVAGQDFGHGGVHWRDDDDLDENEYGEGDLQIDCLDPLADDTFDILVGNSLLRYIGSHSFLIYQTPNGTRFWCPDVSDQKPMVGKPRNNKYDTLDPGSLGCSCGRSFKVTDCKALIRLKAIKGEPKYLLYKFVENHNHLISSNNMDLTRKGRHLNFEDIQFVHKLSLNKVGPTVVHRLQTALKGGHHNMRGTRSTFKNVSRDIRMFIGDRDIQLVVQKLEERAKNLPNFSYEFIHICSDLLGNSTLRSSIHKLVWNIYISPSTFEERLINLMFQFNLGDHVWLSEMFAIRDLWVPAYFRDTPMSCLMKTTSHTEAHASEIYTHSVFKDVQKEIFKRLMNCFISNIDVVDKSKVFTISHIDHNMDFVNEFTVSAHMHDNSVECTCVGFSRIGYLCRHIFCVVRVMKIKEIPDRYVAKCWRRHILPCHVYSISNRLATDDSKESILKNQAMDCVSDCVDKLIGSFQSLSAFVDKMKDMKKSVFDENPGVSNSRKRAVEIEELLGNVDDTTVIFTPPQGIRNEGCGTNRRLVGKGERAIEKSKKTPKLCRSCNQLTFHDSRNCKLRSDNGTSG